MLGSKILDTLKLGHDDVLLWHVQTLDGRKWIQNQKKYLKKRCSVCDSSYRTSCMQVLRGTSCVTRSPVLVLCCVSGGVRGHWGVKGEKGHRSTELKLWLTARCYNYTPTHKPGFLLNTFIILCSFPLLTVVRQSQLNPPLTCFARAGVVANTVSAGKPNRTWHSTPSPGLMMSWCHKYPARVELQSHFPPHTCQCLVCVCVQISDIFQRLSSDRACF